jgi:hypothetical protein
MTTQTAPKLEAQHPPLARDALGNLLAIPDGTCAWRILRETTGRPREIRGPDKQPFRFPLDTTGDEVVEMCGSGVYRVYALDEVGAQLAEEHVARWDLTPGTREPRNGAPDVPMLGSLRTSAAPATTTDLRFALEAMTQMMRTNSDALRIVSESHVDLAKTIATVKGLPRNAAYMLAARAEADDDEEDDEPPVEKPRHFVELLMPLAEKAAEIVPALVAGKMMGSATAANDTKAVSTAVEGQESEEDLASRPNWEARDLMNLNYASRKAAAKRAANERAGAQAAAMATMQRRIAADPAVVPHLMAIKNQLAADEIETLMSAVAGTTEAEQAKFLDAIKSLPVEEAAAFCRDVIASIREQSDAST